MKRWLRNPFVIFYGVLYFLFLTALLTTRKLDPLEAILIFLVVGVGFSVLAWFLTRNTTPLKFNVRYSGSEFMVLGACVLLAVAFITWGINLIDRSFPTEPERSLITLTAKLVCFVFVPLVLLLAAGKSRFSELISLAGWRKHGRIALGMSIVLCLFQAIFGKGLTAIREVELHGAAWPLGMALAWIWLLIEVGLVEEFFFRVLIQSRLSALFNSDVTGIVLMSLIFGLAHAPGLYLRSARTMEAIGTSPSLLLAIGYSIVVTSLTGISFGILWARTRNLPLLMIVHASADLLPNTVPILKAWHFIK